MEKPEIDVVNAHLLTLYSNMETKEKVNFYDSWAQDYEQHMIVMDYQAPRFSVETLDAVYLGDRDSALVLDVPCGTGLVAETLQKLGFKHFHGIEGSKQMLKIAESKDLYQRLTHHMVTADNPLPAQPDSYDLVMIVGGLAQQHLPWEILPEMLRVTKSGEQKGPSLFDQSVQICGTPQEVPPKQDGCYNVKNSEAGIILNSNSLKRKRGQILIGV